MKAENINLESDFSYADEEVPADTIITERIPAAVMDTSFLAAFMLGSRAEQAFEQARKTVLDILDKNGFIFVPALFWYEFGNVILNAAKIKKDGRPARISRSQADDILYDAKDLPIVADGKSDLDILMRTQNIAEEFGLSFYDASYLELARRIDLPLYTLDVDLQKTMA